MYIYIYVYIYIHINICIYIYIYYTDDIQQAATDSHILGGHITTTRLFGLGSNTPHLALKY